MPLKCEKEIDSQGFDALLQDLSSSPPKLVHAWVDLFISKATGKGSAFGCNLLELQLTIYTALENYAAGIPNVIGPTKACFMLFNK